MKEFRNRLAEATEHRENDQNELARAELIQALAYAEKHLGTGSDEFAVAIRKLASLHAHLGEADEELGLLERLLQTREAAGDLAGIIDALQDVAFCHGSHGRHAEAEGLYCRTIGMCDESKPEHHGPLRQTLLYFGDYLVETERYAEAVEVFERGLHVCAVSASYPSTTGSRTAMTLGFALLKLDRFEEAEALLDLALPVVSHRSEPSMAILRRTLHVYANHLHRTDRCEKADKIYQEAIYHFDHGPYVNPIDHAHMLQTAGRNALKLNLPKRAERRFRASIRKFLAHREPHQMEVLSAQHDLVNVLMPAKRYADAEALLTEMVQATEHPEFTEVRAREQFLNNLGFAQVHLEEFPKAEANLRRGLQTAGEERSSYLVKNLGLMYQKMGYTAEAIREYEKAIPLFVKEFGESHPMIATIRETLAELRPA